MNIPSNPFVLLSYINTKLRDQYSSIEQLVDDLNIDVKDIDEILNKNGYYYNRDINQYR